MLSAYDRYFLVNSMPEIVIASGPVILEEGKVLLNREKKDYGITPWLFPGGKVEDLDISLEETCHREAKEEMGIEVEILRPLKTVLIRSIKKEGEGTTYDYVLVHFLAKRKGDVKPAETITEWGWFDINNLPQNSAPNVREVIDSYLREVK